MAKKESVRSAAFALLNKKAGNFSRPVEAAHVLNAELGINVPYARTLVSQWMREQAKNDKLKTFYKVSIKQDGTVRMTRRYAKKPIGGYHEDKLQAIDEFINARKSEVELAKKLKKALEEIYHDSR